MQSALALKAPIAFEDDSPLAVDERASGVIAIGEYESGTQLAAVPSARDSESLLTSGYSEVKLPMKLSHKWVAFACRTANVAKPKWNRLAGAWTTSSIGAGGVPETITITATSDMMSIRVMVDWDRSAPLAHETSSTARRLTTAFVMTMRDGMRRRTEMRQSYEDARLLETFRARTR